MKLTDETLFAFQVSTFTLRLSRTLPGLVLTLMLLFSSCSSPDHQSDTQNSPVTIDLSTVKDQKLPAGEMIKSVKFIPLEFKKGCAISRIYKLDIFNDTIYVLSKNILYLFNNEGKFISRFAHQGRGPGEYTSIFDFCIDRQNRQVILVDFMVNKLKTYDLSGNFIKSNPVGKIWQIEPAEKDLFLSYPMNIRGNQPYSLIVTNGQGDTVKTFPNNLTFQRTGSLFMIPVNGAMYSFNNQIHFKQFLSDTLYAYDKHAQDIYPEFIFTGINNLPVALLGDPDSYNKNAKNYTWVHQVTETNNYLFIMLVKHNKTKHLVYSKVQKKLYSLDSNGKDAPEKQINTFPFLSASGKLQDNIIYSSWPAYFFKKHFKDVVSDQEFQARLKEYGPDNFPQLYQAVKEDGNPVIQMITLK